MQNNLTTVARPRVDLSGKVAVITGAGSEFGLALALQAAQRGMKVALADADPTLLASVHEIVRATGVETLAVCTDPSDLVAMQNLACRVEQQLGPPWLVCNSAGGSTIESNLWGVINGVQVFTAGLVGRGAGHIVNIADADLFGIHGAAVDTAVRHAILGLSESLYRELDSISSQVGVTVIRPSLIDTSLTSMSSMRGPARGGDSRMLSLDELAEQIFRAIQTREFCIPLQVPPMRETTRQTSPSFGCMSRASIAA